MIVIEPLADLTVLAAAKSLHQVKDSPLLERRLLQRRLIRQLALGGRTTVLWATRRRR